MAELMPGAALAERFYREIVRPILEDLLPGLPHGAALLGQGSEVLGFDDRVSTDHDWGPRVTLFLGEADHARHAAGLCAALQARLPAEFAGWPTRFPRSAAPHLGPEHRVEVVTISGFLEGYLGIDAQRPLSARAWLTLPSQKLLTIAAGPVFHDEAGLAGARERLAWYPRDVWLYLLAAGWARIGQEEHLVGRAGQAGDDLGSRILAGRLARDLMRLGFLMERRYAPYPKWFGAAFARLRAAEGLLPPLSRALAAAAWPERGEALAQASAAAARLHNALGATEPLSPDPRPFHGRPFPVIDGDRFADALLARVQDPEIRAIPLRIGGIDQWSDSTDLLEAPGARPRLESLYAPGEDPRRRRRADRRPSAARRGRS